MTAFGFETTADEASAALSEYIKGKAVLITGVTKGGLGFEAARAIAHQQPSLIILAGRSNESNAESEKQIKSEVPNANIRLLQLDLGSFAAVRRAAAEVNGWPEEVKINVLINNAGIMGVPYAKTEDGIERHFATNHLAHFLFTNLIIDRIPSSNGGSRVINLSSYGHHRSNIRWEDWNFEDSEDYQPLLGYGQSKTANILFSVQLAKKLRSRGVLAYSLHPGAVWTNLPKNQDLTPFKKSGVVDENGQPQDTDFLRWKTIPQGGSTTVVAAFDPSIIGQNGSYLADCQVEHTLVASYALDEENAERLWKLSEDLVGQKFEY